MEHGIPATRRVLDNFDVYEADGFTLYCGDFFALTPNCSAASPPFTIARR